MIRTSVGPKMPESIEYLPVILYLTVVVSISQPYKTTNKKPTISQAPST